MNGLRITANDSIKSLNACLTLGLFWFNLQLTVVNFFIILQSCAINVNERFFYIYTHLLYKKNYIKKYYNKHFKQKNINLIGLSII